MAGILLNLLAVNAGGQVTRTEAFLRRFRYHNPNVRLIILKQSQSLIFCDDVKEWEVKNVFLGAGRFRALKRMFWENFFLPHFMRKEELTVYLTFSHYLPNFLDVNVHSIVGISNLAPFSAEAWAVESSFVRIKMWFLRHSIISSAKRADKVIALSNSCKDVLVRNGISVTKITVIPNGVELCDRGDSISPSSEMFINSQYILSVSHFHRYKNFECLLKAYSMLSEDLRKKFSLVIIGNPFDRAYYIEMVSLASKLGIDKSVLIIPGMERVQLNTAYRNASLFVFPSLIENSPNILLEAMACGLPVLANKIDPMPEFGGDAVDYFDGSSAKDLSKHMATILTNDAIAEDFRVRAKKHSKKYSWDVFAERVVALCSSNDTKK